MQHVFEGRSLLNFWQSSIDRRGVVKILALALAIVTSGCELPDGTNILGANPDGQNIGEQAGSPVEADDDASQTNNTTAATLDLSPNVPNVAVSESVTFAAADGTEPYTFSVFVGSGTIDSSTGAYTAPAVATSESVQVEDANGNTARVWFTVLAAVAGVPTAKTLVISDSYTFSATGGEAPYTYVATSGVMNALTGVYVAPATAGSDTITITDRSLRTATVTVTINEALSFEADDSNLATNGTTTITAAGGVPPYSYTVSGAGGTFDSGSDTYTAPNSTGTDVVTVTDADGSTASVTINVYNTLTLSPSTQTVAVSNTISFSASGGTGSYTYSVTAGTGSIDGATGVYTAPGSSGTATVQVEDTGGQTATASVTINDALAISPVTATLAVDNIQVFTASDGVSPYTFEVTAGGGTVGSTSGVYTAPSVVGSGTATVTVTDSYGNTADATITVNAALAISPSSYTLSVSDTETFSASGGVTPYTYSVVGGGAGGAIVAGTGAYTAPGSAGTDTVRVTDANGNTSDATVTVNSAVTIDPTSVTLAVTNEYTFSTTGGSGSYTYSVVGGGAGGSIDSSTGEYTAPGSSGSDTVRVTDSEGNTSDSTVTINDALSVSPTDATIMVGTTQTITPSDGVSPYTYTVEFGSGTVNSSGVYTAPGSAGTARVRATDSLGNYAETSITINAALSLSATDTTVAETNTSTFTASGGVPSYTYTVVGGASNGSITAGGVYTAPGTAGSYTVQVEDAEGNTETLGITVNEPLDLSPATSELAVNETDTFTASDGVSPYSYSVTAGVGTIDSSTGVYTAPSSVGSGTATITVTDAYGNTDTATVTVNAALTISPSTYTLAVSDSETFSASGGVTPYTYSVVGGGAGGSIVAGTGAYTAPGSSGTDTVRVTDANGNTADATVTVNTAPAISPSSITLAVGNETTFTASAGSESYTYSVVGGGAGGTIDSSTGEYTAPGSSGSDTVRVTDSEGNTSDATVTINDAISVSPTDATIMVGTTQTVTPSDGVSPYTYTVEFGSGTVNSIGVYTAPGSAGTARVRATDSLGNYAETSITITSTLSLSQDYSTIAEGDSATFTASGGVPSYTYSVVGGASNGSITAGGVYTAPGTAGSYTIQVDDDDGNTATLGITVNEPVSVSPSTLTLFTSDTQYFSGSDGVSPYTYSITSGSGTIDASTGEFTAAGTAGSVTVRVTDALSNTADATVSVEVPCYHGNVKMQCYADVLIYAINTATNNGASYAQFPSTPTLFPGSIPTDSCVFYDFTDPKIGPSSQDLNGVGADETVTVDGLDLTHGGYRYDDVAASGFPNAGDTPEFIVDSDAVLYPDFTVNMPVMPGAVTDIEIDSVSAPDDTSDDVTLDKSDGVDFTWTQDVANSGFVEIRITSPENGSSQTQEILCVATDDGAFTVPTATLNNMTNFSDAADGSIYVYKVLKGTENDSSGNVYNMSSEILSYGYASGRTAVTLILQD